MTTQNKDQPRQLSQVLQVDFITTQYQYRVV